MTSFLIGFFVVVVAMTNVRGEKQSSDMIFNSFNRPESSCFNDLSGHYVVLSGPVSIFDFMFRGILVMSRRTYDLSNELKLIPKKWTSNGVIECFSTIYLDFVVNDLNMF